MTSSQREKGLLLEDTEAPCLRVLPRPRILNKLPPYLVKGFGGIQSAFV